MKMRLFFPLMIVFMLAGVWVQPARADGIIIPEPPVCLPGPCPPRPRPMEVLEIRYHHVTVTIRDQLAVTHVDQVFYNPNEWAVEGVYVFPIPLEAAVGDFTLWIDGQPVSGEVLDAAQARQTYEQIVRELQDPALLEYAGRGALRASVFPIPPGGEQRIELEYSQVLTAEAGLVHYVYPLNTEKFSVRPLDSVRISVQVAAGAPVRAVYSPSHDIAISREGQTAFTAGYEAHDVRPDRDFSLYYSIGESEALHLLSSRSPLDPGDPDGFFLLLLAPRPQVDTAPQPKDVILVLDRSGSMEGEKFRQAQDALAYILAHLNPEDRFNLVAFSTGLEQFAAELQPLEAVPAALDWVERLSAVGSTDINRALLEAAAQARGERPTYLILLTDGLPTEGVLESEAILANFAAGAPQGLRLFAFGVGYDVDTFLLDTLAQEHHGDSAYVRPGERLDERISTFYARISTPLLIDLELDFGDLVAYDLYPNPLPDLFAGSQIVVLGRYRQGGVTNLALRGTVNGEVQRFTFPDLTFNDQPDPGDAADFLPQLWATRKIGYLLNQVRLQGPEQELIDQIVAISIRYGIVTPYTSYLVTEDLPLGAAEQERLAEETYQELLIAPAAPAYGAEAVEKSVAQDALAEAGSLPVSSAGTTERVKVAGGQAFVLSDGVWVTTAFDPQAMQTVPVAFLSDDYFALSAADPALAAAFALGPRVIAFSNGVAYEVVAADAPVAPLDVPPPATEAAQPSTEATQPVTGNTPAAPADSSTTTPGQPCLGSSLPALFLLVAGLAILWWR
ncbi:MAG: VWA domain-containing protein, partial [Anaerolineales bacterium]|nr:VWA domain-containing protein [Anaerolineales bacterium]